MSLHAIAALTSLLSLAIWCFLLTLRGLFWRSRPELDAGLSSSNPSVCVVIPARDEARGLRQALSSLLSQQYAGELSIVLVDDNSTDGTGEIAAQMSARDPRLFVVRGEPLAEGWSGKLWAVRQGLRHERARRAEYVLLTDADIVHGPTHVASLAAQAERDGLDLTSEMARLNCSTRAERALIPPFVFFFQMLYPFAWVADPRRRLAGAAGGVMFLRRSVLERIDGVEAIRGNLIDDCSLASEVKASGGRIWLGHAREALSLRVYGDWREIWNMIARTAYVQLRHSPWRLAGCAAGMFLVYCAPPLLGLFGAGLTRWASLAAWLMMALSLQPTLRRYGRSPAWGAALPCVSVFYLGATIASAWRHYRGRGGGWKNRTYA